MNEDLKLFGVVDREYNCYFEVKLYFLLLDRLQLEFLNTAHVFKVVSLHVDLTAIDILQITLLLRCEILCRISWDLGP